LQSASYGYGSLVQKITSYPSTSAACAESTPAKAANKRQMHVFISSPILQRLAAASLAQRYRFPKSTIINASTARTSRVALSLRPRLPFRPHQQVPQDPAKRSKLPDAVAKANSRVDSQELDHAGAAFVWVISPSASSTLSRDAKISRFVTYELSGRIASPEMLLNINLLPHLICSFWASGGIGGYEAGEHDDTGRRPSRTRGNDSCARGERPHAPLGNQARKAAP
jgi:hypothetical protein